MKTEKATFGAGCFWHVEHSFRQIKGVVNAVSGYMGGSMKNPTYEDVCTDKTGHVEVVQVEYDPKKISYDRLLEAFWDMHDPTQFNRQGPDVGTQYKSIIFYHNQKQKDIAIKSKEKLQKSGKYNGKIATEIQKASAFYKAEEYHQNYYQKHKIASCLVKLPMFFRKD